MDQENSKYGHFLCNNILILESFIRNRSNINGSLLKDKTRKSCVEVFWKNCQIPKKPPKSFLNTGGDLQFVTITFKPHLVGIYEKFSEQQFCKTTSLLP